MASSDGDGVLTPSPTSAGSINGTLDPSVSNSSELSKLYTSALIVSVICGAWTYFQLRHYARRDMPRPYFAVVFISWWLGIIGAATLLPLDIAIASIDGLGEESHVLHVWWMAEYWITFAFSWVICPILMEYWAAGQFSVKAKLQ
jgi:hypothetical protein